MEKRARARESERTGKNNSGRATPCTEREREGGREEEGGRERDYRHSDGDGHVPPSGKPPPIRRTAMTAAAATTVPRGSRLAGRLLSRRAHGRGTGGERERAGSTAGDSVIAAAPLRDERTD